MSTATATTCAICGAERGERGCSESADGLLFCNGRQNGVPKGFEYVRQGLNGVTVHRRIPEPEPPTKPLILDPADPLPSAREFVARHYRKQGVRSMLYYAGDYFSWAGSHYVIREADQVKSEVYAFLEGAQRAIGKGQLGPYQPTKNKIENVFDALRAVVHTPLEHQPPCWLGTTPDAYEPKELLPCRNGLLHLPTMKLIPSTPEYFCTYSLGVDYNENVKAPPTKWLKFLDSLWPDDAESIDALQDWFGYVLGGDTRQHKMLLLCGPRRGGKGSIARILRGLIGDCHVAAPTLASLQQNFGIQGLIGKPLAIIGDARLSGRADQQAVVERLLSISGEDAIGIDRKYHSPVTLQLPTRFMLLSNELPRLADSSGALASRFVVLRLTESWLGREDVELFDRLVPELPQILGWSLVGLERMRQRKRFIQPASAAEAIGELEDLSSPISAFIRDACAVGDECEVSADGLFQAWRTWCEDQGRTRPGTRQTFGRDLRAALPRIQTVQPRTTTGARERRYVGIRTT